jgi:ABC-2 type transport system permease protein
VPADGAGGVGRPVGRSPGTVVLRHTARRAVRSAALWGCVFGAFVASTAWSYSSLYRTSAQRQALASAFGANRATIALFGPAPMLQTSAGFTVLKTFLTLTVVGAVWGLLTGTRLLRGEEDTGRWDLYLAGATTRGRATAQAVVGLVAGVAVLWAVTAAVVVVAGRSGRIAIAPGAALFFATALVSGALLFVAIGALTSQLGATRRRAAGYAGAVLGASYALRMVADSGTGLHGLIWLTPLGWVENLQPLTSPRPWPLVPIVACTVVLGLAAVQLAAHRDAGSSTIPAHDRSEPRLRLLGGAAGLTVRLTRPTVVAWAVAIGASGLLFGFVVHTAAGSISDSSLRDVLARLGAAGSADASFLGACFLVVAVLLGFVAAGLVAAARTEELEGRLDPLMARSVSRATWLGARLVVAAAALVACALVGGVATLVGALGGGAAVDAGAVMGAALNTVPPAICILGLGALAYGVAPRSATLVVYALVTWSVLVDVVGGVGALNHWVADTSVFHQMAAAPAAPADVTAIAVLLLVGVAGSLAGCAGLARRDLTGG